MAGVWTRGGYSTLVWVGVCRWDFWNATHPCTHFEGKVTHPCTKNQNFSLKFAPFWRKFRKILKSWPIKVPNLRHFGANFRKFWKIDPSKYHVFEKKGLIDVPGGLILLPMFAAHPYNHFCTEYPPRGCEVSSILWIYIWAIVYYQLKKLMPTFKCNVNEKCQLMSIEFS